VLDATPETKPSEHELLALMLPATPDPGPQTSNSEPNPKTLAD
jgi:hypothetical protein